MTGCYSLEDAALTRKQLVLLSITVGNDFFIAPPWSHVFVGGPGGGQPGSVTPAQPAGAAGADPPPAAAAVEGGAARADADAAVAGT